MSKNEKYRHEWKYLIDTAQKEYICRRLPPLLTLDKHAQNGGYMLRSLYFDDYFHTAYEEKDAGVLERKKYRIRIYRYSDKEIFLERKRKLGDLIQKSSVQITRRLCDQLAAGNPSGLQKSASPLLQDVYVQMRTRLLRPKVIVDYTRRAFVYEPGNTRITLDDEVRTGLSSLDFFNPNLATIPADITRPIILEVKYDTYLPDNIRRAIRLNDRRTTNFSKYAACRLTDF